MPLRLFEYNVYLRFKTGLRVLPDVMLLTKSSGVVDRFLSDNKGMFEEGREMVLKGPVTRFKVLPKDAVDAIRPIDSRIVLKKLSRPAISSKNLEQFKKVMKKVLTQ